jgi:secreted trypsin-like serine protease
MKHSIILFLLLFSQSTFALYGSKLETASEDFVVSLHLDDPENGDYDYFCSGVLVSARTVVTAGHCIDSSGLDVYEMSMALVYRPELITVNVGGKKVRARYVTLSPLYFESLGFEAEDLAIIELDKPVAHVKPIRIASKRTVQEARSFSLIARGKRVEAIKKGFENFGSTAVSFIQPGAGACRGDSGGAVVVQEKGEPKLAGILMYDGEGNCQKKAGYAYFPKAKF